VTRINGVELYVEWIDPHGAQGNAADDGPDDRPDDAPDDGPVLIFLHDSLGATSTWREFPRRLAERVQLRAMSYDRRGYGRSDPFGESPRTPAYLEDEVLVALIDALGIEHAALFGHSDGGSIALLAAAIAAERIARVVTEGAHVFVEERTLDGIREAQQTFATTDLAQRLVRHHGDKVDRVVAAWIDTWLTPEYRDWNIERYVSRIACPVLAIQGEDDEYGTPAQVDAIVTGATPNARGMMIPGVGHTPHREAEALVLDAAADFIAGA
jgi:pimeloyl-ACP methyl ester carboxylesterase